MIPAQWRTQWRRVLAPLLICLVLLVSACSKPESRFAQTQEDTSRRNAPAAVAKGTEQGGTFNKFFPGSAGGYSVVPSQEKKGFAEYKLNKDGKTFAMLSVNDTTGTPTAAAKFQASTEKIGGYPAVDQGANITAILVNDRYQVKVQSRDPAFTKEDRTDWLQKFDLRGLAKLPTAAAKLPMIPKPASPKFIPTPTAPSGQFKPAPSAA
jgi:hypothetical protein